MSATLPFQWHVLVLLVLVALVVGLGRVVRGRVPRRQAAGAVVAFAAVSLWPVGDLAGRVSLAIATSQRLVIMVLVAPLVLLSLPTTTIIKLTHPPLVDAITRRLVQPGVALVLSGVLATFTLTPSVVNWGARNANARDLVVLLTFFTGVVLWLPALALLPGTKRLSPTARAGYIFVAAFVVTSLSFVWIFAHHSLYPGLHQQRALLGISPLTDQQIAVVVAKLGSYLPMWTVAIAIFSHAEEQGIAQEESPLHWADVERELLRVDRQRARAERRARVDP